MAGNQAGTNTRGAPLQGYLVESSVDLTGDDTTTPSHATAFTTLCGHNETPAGNEFIRAFLAVLRKT